MGQPPWLFGADNNTVVDTAPLVRLSLVHRTRALVWCVSQLFVPGQPAPANTVMIAEQLPGIIVSGDVTDILNFGYWPSYNRAYFQEVGGCGRPAQPLTLLNSRVECTGRAAMALPRV